MNIVLSRINSRLELKDLKGLMEDKEIVNFMTYGNVNMSDIFNIDDIEYITLNPELFLKVKVDIISNYHEAYKVVKGKTLSVLNTPLKDILEEICERDDIRIYGKMATNNVCSRVKHSNNSDISLRLLDDVVVEHLADRNLTKHYLVMLSKFNELDMTVLIDEVDNTRHYETMDTTIGDLFDSFEDGRLKHIDGDAANKTFSDVRNTLAEFSRLDVSDISNTTALLSTNDLSNVGSNIEIIMRTLSVARYHVHTKMSDMSEHTDKDILDAMYTIILHLNSITEELMTILSDIYSMIGAYLDLCYTIDGLLTKQGK